SQLRERNEGAIVSSSCGRNDIWVISAFSQTNGSRCHPRASPGDTCFRITALRDVNQFGQIVGLARIDGRQIAPFSLSRFVLAKSSFISWKRRRRPRPHRRRRRIIAAKCDPDRDEKLRRPDESGLHEDLPNSGGTYIMLIMAGRQRKCRAQTLIRYRATPFYFIQNSTTSTTRRPVRISHGMVMTMICK